MICKNCGKEFEGDWRKEKRGECLYCSRSCSSTRTHSDSTKRKIKESVINFRKEEGLSLLGEQLCSECGVRLGKHNKSGLCKKCKPYISPPKSKYEHIKNFRRKRKAYLVQYKGGKCSICGYNKCMEALDFHHIDPALKLFSIGAKFKNRTRNLEEEILEVDKCILVCANCHREIHSNMKNAGLSPHSDKV